MEEALSILKIHSIQYFKLVFLNICNCTYKTPFGKSGHIYTYIYIYIYIYIYYIAKQEHLGCKKSARPRRSSIVNESATKSSDIR